MIELLKYKKL